MRVITWLFSVWLLGLATTAGAAPLNYTTYYHNDHLGSPVAATDASGALLWRAHFRPYGERQEDSKDAAFGTVGYTGHTQDKDSGLVYAGARYLDPLLGRFMAVDPVGFTPSSPVSFNRYAYGNNSPYRFTDPDGRNPVYAGIVVYGAVTGAVGGYISASNSAANPYGKFISAAVGAGAGAAAAATLNPEASYAAGMAVGALSSVAGQVAGSVVDAGITKGIENVEFSDVKVSPITTGFGALAVGPAAMVGKGVAESIAVYPLIGTNFELAGTPTVTALAAGAFADGAINGVAEKIASKVQESKQIPAK